MLACNVSGQLGCVADRPSPLAGTVLSARAFLAIVRACLIRELIEKIEADVHGRSPPCAVSDLA